MSSSPFNSRKNSMHTNTYLNREFDDFFRRYKSRLVHGQLPTYVGTIKDESMKEMMAYLKWIRGGNRAAPTITEGNDQGKGKEKTANEKSEDDDEATSEKIYESSMYTPVLLALTRASFDVTPSDASEVLVFCDHHNHYLKVMSDTGDEKPDLAGHLEKREVALSILKTKGSEIRKQCKETLPNSHEIKTAAECKNEGQEREDEAGQTEKQDQKTVRKAFTETDDGKQLFRYLFVVSRHDPSSLLVYGFFINRAEFRLVALGLDYHIVWPSVQWDSEDAIQALYACMKLICDEARRTYPPEAPRLAGVMTLVKRTVATYTIEVRGRRFRLLSLFYGRSNGRKPFVALGVAEDEPTFIRVFKYSWYPSYQHGRESKILKRIKSAPGVVQIDEELSTDVVDDNSVAALNMSNGERVRSLLVLKTVGYPLAACKSVLEFLEAMYDLLEVLRYLAQEKKILHRDISWTNVLIRPVNQGEENEKEREGECAGTSGQEEVSAQNDEAGDGDGIPHKYHFISDIFNEDRRRLRVALADFDHASDLSADSIDDLKDATGTPIFMAADVLSARGRIHMGRRNPIDIITEETTDSALGDFSDKYADEDEKAAWDDFYKNGMDRLRWDMRSRSDEDDMKLEQSFRHGPVHDAESVFYICFLFFIRMWPFDEKVKDAERRALEIGRGELFEKLLMKVPRVSVNLRHFFETIRAESRRSPHLRPFFKLLQFTGNYLEVPWYNVQSTRRGERYEYHLHDFMQRLLLKEIKRLKTSEEPIPLEQTPLLVRTPLQVIGGSFSALSRRILSPKRLEGDRKTPGSKPDRHTSRAAGQPAMNKQIAKVPDPHGTSAVYSQPKDIVPVERPKQMSYKEKKQFKGLPETFLDIRWWKEQEKLWLACDKLNE